LILQNSNKALVKAFSIINFFNPEMSTVLFLSPRLIDALGVALNLPLAFDEHDQCLIIIDDRLMIAIRNAQDSLILYGMLGDFYSNIDTDFFEKILLINKNLAEQDQGALIFNKENSSVLYIKHIRSKINTTNIQQDFESFCNILDNLIDEMHNK